MPKSSESNRNPTHYLQIQSLRAIAVVLVILFHIKSGFSNGYFGVDIFFVISGYVITLRALDEILQTKKFNFMHFLSRRMFRLMPALAVMLCFSAILSFFFQTPYQPVGQQQVTAKTGLSSLFFGANIAIPKISGGYFGTLAQNNSMTHLWTISVEGQFYLFFAAVLILILKMKFTLKRFIMIIGLVGSTSAILFFSGERPEVFFGTLTRAWEFCLGVMLAVLVTHLSNKTLPRHRQLGALLAYSSIVLLFLSQLGYPDKSENYSLIFALMGTVFLLFLTGIFPIHPLRRFLENKILVALGNASYSIYLWHWPLIIFFGLSWPTSGYKSLFVLPITLALGLTSYFLVERKFAFTPSSSKKSFLKISALILVSVLSLSTLGYGARMAWGLDWFGLTNPPVDSLYECVPYLEKKSVCFIQSKESTKKLLIMGDSQAASLAKPFIDLAKKNNWDFFLVSSPGDPYLDSRCSVLNECKDERTHTILDIKPDYLVIANLWNLETSPSFAKDKFERRLLYPLTVNRYLKNTRLVLVSPIPTVSDFNLKFTFVNKYFLRNWYFGANFNEYQNEIRETLLLKSRNANHFSLIDPSLKICKSDLCDLLYDGNAIYRDSAHLTPRGAIFAIGSLSIMN